MPGKLGSEKNMAYSTKFDFAICMIPICFSRLPQTNIHGGSSSLYVCLHDLSRDKEPRKQKNGKASIVIEWGRRAYIQQNPTFPSFHMTSCKEAGILKAHGPFILDKQPCNVFMPI